jgi:hypothetical protein
MLTTTVAPRGSSSAVAWMTANTGPAMAPTQLNAWREAARLAGLVEGDEMLDGTP